MASREQHCLRDGVSLSGAGVLAIQRTLRRPASACHPVRSQGFLKQKETFLVAGAQAVPAAQPERVRRGARGAAARDGHTGRGRLGEAVPLHRSAGAHQHYVSVASLTDGMSNTVLGRVVVTVLGRERKKTVDQVINEK